MSENFFLILWELDFSCSYLLKLNCKMISFSYPNEAAAQTSINTGQITFEPCVHNIPHTHTHRTGTLDLRNEVFGRFCTPEITSSRLQNDHLTDIKDVCECSCVCRRTPQRSCTPRWLSQCRPAVSAFFPASWRSDRVCFAVTLRLISLLPADAHTHTRGLHLKISEIKCTQMQILMILWEWNVSRAYVLEVSDVDVTNTQIVIDLLHIKYWYFTCISS